MNRVLKKVALAGCILFVLGVICTGIGVFLGGQMNYVFDLNTHEVYVPTKEEEAEYVDKTLDVETFNVMEVQLDNVELEIKSGEDYQVSYYFPAWNEPTVEVQDKKLVVKNKRKNVATYGWNFDVLGIHIGPSSTSKEAMKMTITVPRDVDLTDMKVYSEYGNVSIADVQSEGYHIEAESGDIALKNVTLGSGVISAGYGDVTVEKFEGMVCSMTVESGACLIETMEVDTLALQADYGNVDMQNNVIKNFAILASSGNIDISDLEAESSSIIAEYGEVAIKNLTGKTCIVEADSGQCDVDALQLDVLEITASYGDVTVAECRLKGITIIAQNGAIYVRDTKADTIALEDEYGNVLIEDVELNDVNILCESGNCDLGLVGNVEDYDMDITVEAGNLEINGEEQGNKYKSVSEKEKSIVIQSEYGNVDVWIEAK